MAVHDRIQADSAGEEDKRKKNRRGKKKRNKEATKQACGRNGKEGEGQNGHFSAFSLLSPRNNIIITSLSYSQETHNCSVF